MIPKPMEMPPRTARLDAITEVWCSTRGRLIHGFSCISTPNTLPYTKPKITEEMPHMPRIRPRFLTEGTFFAAQNPAAASTNPCPTSPNIIPNMMR
ncbi:MAG: hypothetical protein BWY06_03423 [Candidatus Latescibacteria bacterium ADurb.Bin168]|nr:MAG: hypothetical protein BWY06_03423 [Candidatus Latescibacteria bacterium ADurb.Bin168]